VTIVGYILGALGAFLVLLNYSALVTNWQNRRRGIDRFQSSIPLIGGIFSAVGVYLVTGSAWSPLVALLDPGCVFVLLFPLALLQRTRGPNE
jgi:hypothetical protein